MLLTLDLSSRVGWTLGDIADSHFRSGVHRLPSTGEDIGAFAEAFDAWLHGTALDADHVVFESPILPRQTMLATVRKLSGLCWHTEFFAKMNNIRCEEANIQHIKKFISGKGDAKKPEMVRAVELMGFKPEDDNEADAIATRLYVIGRQRPDLLRAMKFDLGPLGMASARA